MNENGKSQSKFHVNLTSTQVFIRNLFHLSNRWVITCSASENKTIVSWIISLCHHIKSLTSFNFIYRWKLILQFLIREDFFPVFTSLTNWPYPLETITQLYHHQNHIFYCSIGLGAAERSESLMDFKLFDLQWVTSHQMELTRHLALVINIQSNALCVFELKLITTTVDDLET